jgi:hypothetical protein
LRIPYIYDGVGTARRHYEARWDAIRYPTCLLARKVRELVAKSDLLRGGAMTPRARGI